MVNDSHTTRPMADPSKQRTGVDTGGILSNAEGGLADALERSFERRTDDAVGRATTGEGMSGGTEPRVDLGGKDEPGASSGGEALSPDTANDEPSSTRTPADRDAGGIERETPTRRDSSTASPVGPTSSNPLANEPPAGPPDEPANEGPLESLGRAVSEAVLGGVPDVPDDAAYDERSATPARH